MKFTLREFYDDFIRNIPTLLINVSLDENFVLF